MSPRRDFELGRLGGKPLGFRPHLSEAHIAARPDDSQRVDGGSQPRLGCKLSPRSRRVRMDDILEAAGKPDRLGNQVGIVRRPGARTVEPGRETRAQTLDRVRVVEFVALHGMPPPLRRVEGEHAAPAHAHAVARLRQRSLERAPGATAGQCGLDVLVHVIRPEVNAVCCGPSLACVLRRFCSLAL